MPCSTCKTPGGSRPSSYASSTTWLERPERFARANSPTSLPTSWKREVWFRGLHPWMPRVPRSHEGECVAIGLSQCPLEFAQSGSCRIEDLLLRQDTLASAWLNALDGLTLRSDPAQRTGLRRIPSTTRIGSC